LSELRDQIFLFLLKNAGRKFTIAEIAKSFNIEAKITRCYPYANLRSLLDQMTEFALIESMPENGSTSYFISKSS
jgi:predicted AAA+ superfamily ATPase